MDTTGIALLALAVGAAIGAALVAMIMLAMRTRDRARAANSADVPDGAQAVLNGMDEAALVVDASLVVVAASAQAEPFGLREGIALPDDDLRHLVRSARNSGIAESITFRLTRQGLALDARLVVARAVVITPRLTLVVVRDITERERVEEMRRDFVSNTSHELKTPVGAVSLLAEAIESASDDPEQVRKFAARLSSEATRLSQLTSRIMNLSRLQSADELTNIREVSVDEVVATAIESQAVAADAAGLDIVRGGAHGLYVRGDVQILTDAVVNLLANAVAYSPAGVHVGIGVTERDGTVEIAITDHGIGIPEGEQQRIFERFYRADQARSRRTGGTGLGLSIVKHAVQRHGGEVEVWSRPGRGSTFTIRLASIPAPVVAPDKSTKRHKKSAAPLAKKGSRS